MEQHDTPEKTYDLERLIFFTDGVFAIVITLLVIELHPPQGWDRTFLGLLRSEWRSLVAYGVSFLAVGSYWNLHRSLFGKIVRFHPGLVVFNLLLLALVVLLPFANQLIFETGPRGEPFEILLGLVAAIGVAHALLWGFAAFVAGVVDPRIGTRVRWIIFAVMLLGPALVCYLGMTLSGREDFTPSAAGAMAGLVALALLRRWALAHDPTRGDKAAV